MKPALKHCPTCGSSRIRHRKKDWHGTYKNEEYTVEDLEYDECADCGEQVFDRDAVRHMQEVSPAFKHLKRNAA